MVRANYKSPCNCIVGLYFKVYMTDFFLFARLNLPNVLISVPKKFFP